MLNGNWRQTRSICEFSSNRQDLHWLKKIEQFFSSLTLGTDHGDLCLLAIDWLTQLY